jgi:uncharacterized membrane protein
MSPAGFPRTAPADPVTRHPDVVARSRGARIGWVTVTLFAVMIPVFVVTPYLMSSLATLAQHKTGLAANYAGRPLPIRIAFYVHVTAGGLALLLGPWQFSRWLRTRRPQVHRTMGRLGLVAIGIAGAAGLLIAPVSEAGLNGFFGFSALALLWLSCAARAFAAIRRGDLGAHQAWAIRTFALTFAAVTLRLWLPALIAVQIPFHDGPLTGEAFDRIFANAYGAVPFLCWLPNLVVAEILVRRRGLPAI